MKTTDPQIPSAKREREVEDMAPTIPPDSRYRVPEDLEIADLQYEVIGFMNRVDEKFVLGETRMGKHEDQLEAVALKLDGVKTSVTALNATVKNSVTKRDTFMMFCTAVSTGVLVLFFLMRVFGPLDLTAWGFGGAAQAQQRED